MTETQWRGASDLRPMLDYLLKPAARRSGYRTTDRKLRLFAAACCRAWPISYSTRDEAADVPACIDAAERWADGDTEAGAALRRMLGDGEPGSPGWVTPSGAASLVRPDAALAAREFAAAADFGKGEAITALLRDIVGNPFRPVARLDRDCPKCGRSWASVGTTSATCAGRHTLDVLRPEWVTPQVLTLARAAYEERPDSIRLDQFRLMLVAEGLEDAGCACEELLSHLRAAPATPGGGHVRGCWALDLVLGKH